ncbi:hypothetical protein HK105_201890 [Polyrhizophydium stewartii]|uniref:Protein kinase domain-containing protein n=1 Tax=Polyrhizophydium stewartii TaxID=2732419 RepID=A0ABR4NG23_9FUNG
MDATMLPHDAFGQAADQITCAAQCLKHFIRGFIEFCEKNNRVDFVQLMVGFLDIVWRGLFLPDPRMETVVAMECGVTYNYSLADQTLTTEWLSKLDTLFSDNMTSSTLCPPAAQGGSAEILVTGATPQLAALRASSKSSLLVLDDPMTQGDQDVEMSVSEQAEDIAIGEAADALQAPAAAAHGSHAAQNGVKTRELHSGVKEPKFTERQVLEKLGENKREVGLEQLKETAEGQNKIDLLQFTKAKIEKLPAGKLQPRTSNTAHGASRTSATTGGASASKATMSDFIAKTIKDAGNEVSAAADDAMQELAKLNSPETEFSNEKDVVNRVKILLQAVALLLGQTGCVVVEWEWLKKRGYKCDLGFVFTTPNGRQMIFAIEVKHGRLFDLGKPLEIDSKGRIRSGKALGILKSYNQGFLYMAESDLDVSIITNFTQTIVMHSRLEDNKQLATTFGCFEDSSGHTLFVLLYSLLKDVRKNQYGRPERNFVQHDLCGKEAARIYYSMDAKTKSRTTSSKSSLGPTRSSRSTRSSRGGGATGSGTAVAVAADNPYGYERGAMTAQGSGSLPHHDEFTHLQFKEIPKAAVTTRQSMGLTLGEDALDAPLHGGSAMPTGSLVLDGASSWMAKSLDPTAPPDCLRFHEVHSLAVVRKQDICSTAEDVQCLAPGIKPNDIIVGAHIGAGLFGAVREALFQGRPAALKQIVLHRYADNILVYHHEVRMYLKLRGLWGYSVAELFTYGMDSHRSVSIITERGTLSEEWPESDEELAVKSLREIHRLGVLHGDPHVKNVVFVGEGRRRRALWIDFERSKFSSDKYEHDEEVQGLREAAESVRRMVEQEQYNAKERLRKAVLVAQ